MGGIVKAIKKVVKPLAEISGGGLVKDYFDAEEQKDLLKKAGEEQKKKQKAIIAREEANQRGLARSSLAGSSSSLFDILSKSQV